MSDLLHDGPADAKVRLILAHGAGAPMDTPFMSSIAERVSATGIAVTRFEFDYMQKRRVDGRRRGPDRAPALSERFRNVISEVRPRGPIFIGGKSMGGRVASMLADDAGAEGLVCLGYPFHPPGKPERIRTDHLRDLRTPTLILQGTRDPFGTPEDVARYDLSPAIEIHWLEDGDHSFKPRKKSGRTLEQNLAESAEAIVRFVNAVSG